MPVVRVTGVLPQLRTEKLEGALMSYHSFLVKGSTLPREDAGDRQGTAQNGSHRRSSRQTHLAAALREPRALARASDGAWVGTSQQSQMRARCEPHIFFPLPFLPFDRRLFLPTAMTNGAPRPFYSCLRGESFAPPGPK